MDSPSHPDRVDRVIEAQACKISKGSAYEDGLLELLCEASLHEDITLGVGLPPQLNFSTASSWLDSASGPHWAILHGSSPVGAIFTRHIEEAVAPEYGGYMEISTFILPPYRGLGLIYRVMPQVHDELSAKGLPGVHAFTWQANHSPTRLWRKLGYSLLGRMWISQGDYAGWKLIWAYPLSG